MSEISDIMTSISPIPEPGSSGVSKTTDDALAITASSDNLTDVSRRESRSVSNLVVEPWMIDNLTKSHLCPSELHLAPSELHLAPTEKRFSAPFGDDVSTIDRSNADDPAPFASITDGTSTAKGTKTSSLPSSASASTPKVVKYRAMPRTGNSNFAALRLAIQNHVHEYDQKLVIVGETLREVTLTLTLTL